MKPIGWKGESLRHSLAARGYKTTVSKVNQRMSRELPTLYRKVYNSWERRNARKLDALAHEQSLLYQSLGVRYRDEIRKQPWFKRPLTAGAVIVLPSERYNRLKQEESLSARGEMSYAMTTLSPDGRRERIIIRDSGSKRLNAKLLRHEMEEYKIYRKLVGAGMAHDTARPLAHELTFTKVNDAEVDAAYGDIGDPT